MFKQYFGKVAKNQVVLIEHTLIYHQCIAGNSDDNVALLVEKSVIDIDCLGERCIDDGVVAGVRTKISASFVELMHKSGEQTGVAGSCRALLSFHDMPGFWNKTPPWGQEQVCKYSDI